MRKIGFIIAVLCAVPTVGFADASSPADLPLLPQPRHVMSHAGTLPLGKRVRVAAFGASGKPYTFGEDKRIDQGVQRFAQLARKVADIEVCYDACDAAQTVELFWQRSGALTELAPETESYRMTVDSRRIVISATTDIGILRGLTTLSQWLHAYGPTGALPQVDIFDTPRFVWRGLLIDVARNFVPVDSIRRNLDAMAAVKLNVLHWHLTDDQGFRVESLTHPELHQQGSDGLYYTQQDVRDVIAYADSLGIRVVPEFDIPGHTASWLVSHPHLASGEAPKAVPQHWGILDDVLDPTREETYALLDQFLGEMSKLFPDPYMHLGGDEVTGRHWRDNPSIVAFMQAHNLANEHALHTYFLARVAGMVKGFGKNVVGWDEVLQPGLAEGTVVQSWRGEDGLRTALQAGYDTILSGGYYLDEAAVAGDYYLRDPEGALDADHAGRLLGAEACQWGELVGADNVEGSIWPRTLAIAERFWSPRDVRDVGDMYRRLKIASQLLKDEGVDHHAFSDKAILSHVGAAWLPAVSQIAAALEPDRANWWEGFTQRAHKGDRLADALYPESELGHDLLEAARGWVASGHAAATSGAVGETLAHVRTLPQRLAEVQGQHLDTGGRMLADARQAVAALDAVAALGQDCVRRLASGEKPDAEWMRHAQQTLDTNAKQKLLGVRVAVTPAVKTLLEAVQAMPEHASETKKP